MTKKDCAHQWNFKHPSGYVVCNKCKKVYAEKAIKEQAE